MEQAPSPAESDVAAMKDLKRMYKEAIEAAEKDLETHE
jgi:hypothetical protein